MQQLAAGDIFVTANPMWLGRAINAVQRFWAPDGRAEYTHAGILLGPKGTTFEALWTNRRQGLFAAYAGERVLIGRHRGMTPERFDAGLARVAHLEGRWYAGHRLLLHLFPPLARMIATGGFAVCSELTAKFLVGAGLMNHWSGVTPDYLADMVRLWADWETVFEGELPETAHMDARERTRA